MKLNQLLNEATTSELSFSNFPIIIKNITDKHKEWFQKDLETINVALKNKHIVNPVFKSLKDSLNRILETAVNNYIAERYFYSGKYEALPEEIRYMVHFLSLHTVPARMKLVNKLQKSVKHPLLDDFKALLEESTQLVEAMDQLKDYNFKKVRDPEAKEKEAKEKFKARVAHADVKKIYDLLTQITQDVRAKVLQANNSWLMNIVTAYQQQYDPTNKKTGYYEFSKHNPFARDVLGSVIEYENGRTEKLKDDYKQVILKQAERITADMLQHFIVKNTEKLSAIATAKNNLKDVKIIRSQTSRGVVEGTLDLSFDDGSHFTVVNKVVISTSKYGKPFYRFPTTFHNVIMPDGSKMKGPSEERMNEIFAKA